MDVKQLLKKKKSYLLMTFCIIIAAVMIFLPTGKEKESNAVSGYREIESYTEQLERRIEKLCSAVDGVDSPVVLVTLESGTEHIYADNKTVEGDSAGNSSYTSDYLILDKGDGSEPLLVREVCPQVRGVAVVVNGGASASLKQKLTELLCASLGIPSSRIMVTG